MENVMRKYILAAIMAVFAGASAYADPVASMLQPATSYTGAQSARAGATAATSGRSAGRTSAPTASAAAAKAGAINTTVKNAGTPSRAVGARTTNNSRSTGAAANSRSVVARTTTGGANTANRARSVVSRVGVTGNTQSAARVSLTGTAMRANTGLMYSNMSSAYTSYTNIIDPMTGLISADAYNNCMTSYYTCMDEICTARNPGQRRCACAGRVKTFANLEQTLQSAREDLLKVSGELSLFIASKGESLNSAFSLTDAEKTLNCVSWRDVVVSGGDRGKWCFEHFVEGTTSTTNSSGDKVYSCPSTWTEPAYCADTSVNGIGLGTDWMKILNGSDSDIIAALRSYADTANQANVIIQSNNNELSSAIKNVEDVINSLNGGTVLFGTTTTTSDSLAETWGYELFQYAHNNVCNRVLDACFNGIYEACGSHNGTTGPYNLNSTIKVVNGDLDFVISGSNTSTSTASCYGYTTNSGDPYNTLRKPVADARRSILQKYALDANADCDIYGEELKTSAQNMNYQRIAATQLLQQKRLEFAQEKEATTESDLVAARTNFNNCLNEVYDCYNHQVLVNPAWSTARVKSYCAQVAEVPSCYETMVCNQEAGAIIDVADSASCSNTADWTKNTCRNITRLSEILNGASATATAPSLTGNSANFREHCLRNAPGVYGPDSIREFDATKWREEQTD